MALSLTLPSDQHYLLTRSYHLTLSLTDQHPVPVSNTSAEREVDKNGRVSLNPSPFTAAAWPCYVKPFGVREAWPLLKLGTKFNFHPLFHISGLCLELVTCLEGQTWGGPNISVYTLI